MRSSADRKVVRSKLPSAVEKISSSAGLTIAPPALPSADSELPPRSTIVLSGENVVVGTSASGTPSRFVSTGFALDGSKRCTRRLKNWVGAEVVLDAELLDVGPVHEDDLRLDRHLRRADVQPFHELFDVVDARG